MLLATELPFSITIAGRQSAAAWPRNGTAMPLRRGEDADMGERVGYLAGVVATLLLVSACTSLGGHSGTALDLRGRVLEGTYSSPSGRFVVKVPRLLQPGASISDEIDADGNVSVRFMDDLCRFFGIQEVSGPEPEAGRLVDMVMGQETTRLKQAGATLPDPRSIDTAFGRAVWLSYQHPAGAPCQRLEIDAQGKRLVQPDADVDLVVLYAGGRYYRVLYVRARDVRMAVAGFTGSGEDAFKALLDSLVVAKP